MPTSPGYNNELDYSVILDGAPFESQSTHPSRTPGPQTDSDSVNEHNIALLNNTPRLSSPASGTAHNHEDIGESAVPVESQWGIHWKSPTLMLSLFIFGILASIAHHVYYQSLHDTNVASTTTQQWAIRIGTGLAFLVKASLAASVGVAFSQRIWVTLRSKPISLQAMDDLFSLTADPTSFFSWEVIRKAKVLCFLAASMWCIPLIATITPATLSVHLKTSHSTTEVLVPYLDWSNTTSYVNFFGAGFIEGASLPVHRVIAATATAGNIIQVPAHYQNSSYTLDFFGPSLRCYNLSDATERQRDEKYIASLQEMFDKTISMNYGTPPIWIGNTTADMLDTVFIYVYGQNLTCNLWNTTYTVLINSTATSQSTTITRLAPLSAVQIKPGDLPPAYTASQIAYTGYSTALSAILTDTIRLSVSGNNNNNNAFILKTSLASCPELVAGLAQSNDLIDPSQTHMCRNGSILRAIEDLSHNFTLSLLSTNLLSGNASVRVAVSTPTNRYVYNWRNLAVAYGAGVVVALVGVCVGAWSYCANGYSASTAFSSIVATTRNEDLDRLVRGRWMPAQPLAREVGRAELRYGMLGAGGGHAAFGFVETVRDLKKGVSGA